MQANDTQVAGSHYRADVQHWDYTVQALRNRYMEGQITKYAARHRKKNGIQDIEKAIHFTQKLQEQFQQGYLSCMGVGTQDHARHANDVTHRFIVANGLNTAEAAIARRLTNWTSMKHLDDVMTNLSVLRRDAMLDQRRMDGVKAGSGYVNQDR